MSERPIACDRSGLTPRDVERQKALQEELRPLVLERVELADGVAFRLPAEKIVAIAELVAVERRCCSFLSLTLEVDASTPDVWLRLTGPKGARDVLKLELAL